MRYIVRAVPERIRCVAYLKACIPELEVVWDQRRDAMETFLRAMDTDAGTGAVHLEEDVVLTRGFQAKAEAVIAERPDAVVQFFSRRSTDEPPGCWDRTLTCTPGFYLPPGFAPGLAAYYPRWATETTVTKNFFDYMLSDYLKLLGRPYWLSVPSLVQHLDLPSAIGRKGGGGRSRRRHSHTFVDPWLPKEAR